MVRQRFLTALGVTGELLITAGVIVLLYLGWQLWINNALQANAQQRIVEQNIQAWGNETPNPTATGTWPAPVLETVGKGGIIGNLYIPRFGASSTRAVGESVDPNVTLNRGYYGHYSQTQMPGEPGNFALAHHRGGWGSAFKQAQLLRTGDHIYLETKLGYYGYTIRNIEYVRPTGIDVLNEVPGSTDSPGKQSYLTITTCSPIDGNAERLIIYADLDSFRTRKAGPFPELAPLIAKA